MHRFVRQGACTGRFIHRPPNMSASFFRTCNCNFLRTYCTGTGDILLAKEVCLGTRQEASIAQLSYDM